MVVRLVQMRVKPGRMAEFQRFYEEHIIPALEGVTGCRSTALAQNIQRDEELISLTVWDSAQHSSAYERGGMYANLIARSKPYFIEGDEWHLQLGDDAQLELAPVVEEPVVKSYSNVDVQASQPSTGSQVSFMFLRMVKMVLRPGMEEEFQRVYEEIVRPELLRLGGCRGAFVVRDLDHQSDWVSMTIWDRKEDADRHEEGGSSTRLRAKLSPFLSGLYQWKRGLDKDLGKQAITSEDVSVTGYRVMTGKRLID